MTDHTDKVACHNDKGARHNIEATHQRFGSQVCRFQRCAKNGQPGLQSLLNILAPASVAAVLLTTPLIASPLDITATYAVSVAGNIVANMDVILTDTGTAYTLELDANVSGLGQLLARGSASIEVSGQSSRSAFDGEQFMLQTLSGGDAFQVDVQYQSGNVTAFIIDPPLQPRIDHIPLERGQLHGVNDMLSTFIIKNAQLDSAICNRRLKVFTGMERFDLVMNFASFETATSTRTGYQGPVVLCQIDYQPISGHYTTSEITSYLDASDRILIWYAPVEESGTFIPYRVLIGTAIGDLSVVLTRLH